MGKKKVFCVGVQLVHDPNNSRPGAASSCSFLEVCGSAFDKRVRPEHDTAVSAGTKVQKEECAAGEAEVFSVATSEVAQRDVY